MVAAPRGLDSAVYSHRLELALQAGDGKRGTSFQWCSPEGTYLLEPSPEEKAICLNYKTALRALASGPSIEGTMGKKTFELAR